MQLGQGDDGIAKDGDKLPKDALGEPAEGTEMIR